MLGVFAALFGGVFDNIVIFLINIIYSIPGVLIGIVVATLKRRIVIKSNLLFQVLQRRIFRSV